MSDFLLVIAGACMAVAVMQSFFNHSRSSQRRIYWSCTAVGAAAAFLMGQPDWKEGLGAALFVLGVMAVAAYAYSPYIKIGGKIYALTVQDNQPDPNDTPESESRGSVHDPAPDAYSGLLTAKKMWWMVVGLLVISSVNTIAFVTGEGEWWVAAIGIAFLVFLAVTTGYGDASWGYGIVRGQHIQFGVATVVTAGVFAVLYLLAYQTAKRWPIRREQSMEYRAHPRHRSAD